MKTEHHKLEGDLRVDEEFRLHGMISESVLVAPQGIFHLYGMVSRDLYLEPALMWTSMAWSTGTV